MGTAVAQRITRQHMGDALSSRSEATSGTWRARAATLGFSLLLTLSLAAVGTYAGYQLQNPPEVRAEETPPVYLPNIEFLRLASLGYRTALANVLWFRTISYFGSHYRSDRLYPWLARMCDVVTDLDPRAQHVYRFAGVILPWEAGLPDDGIAILEKGIRTFPDSWQLRFLLGFDYFFFKNDIARALPHVRRATELPGSHAYVSRLAALLYAEQHGTEMAREFLNELRTNSDAPELRAVIGVRLKELQLGQDIGLLDRAIAAYRGQFDRLPPSLDDLVHVGILSVVPADPFGGSYVYDPATGTVTSRSSRRPMRLHTSNTRSQVLEGRIPRD